MTISSDDSKCGYPRSDANLALRERMRRARSTKASTEASPGTMHIGLSRRSIGSAATGAAALRSSLKKLELALAKARNERVLKTALGGGRVLFVKSMAAFKAKPARSKAMTDAQLRAVARRIARR